MGQRPKKSIAIILTNSFAVLNMVHSGLLKQLEKEYRIYIISNLLSRETLHFINNHFNMSVELLPCYLRQEPWPINILRTIQKVAFFELFQIETYLIKMRRWDWRERRFASLLTTICSSALMKEGLIILLKRLIIRLSPFYCKIHHELPAIDGILSTSPLDIRENILVNSFTNRKIRSMGLVISWDNLTTKGVINSHFNELLVWNQIMVAECEYYHRKANSCTHFRVAGNPRYDQYFQKENRKGPATSSHPLNCGSRTILFATSSPKHFPAQAAIIKDIVDYSKTKKNCLLKVRCHPHDQVANYYDFENEEACELLYPAECAGPWIPDIDYLKMLRETIMSCDVCIQVASTFSIDAAACGKPVVDIAYDGPFSMPFRYSVRRFYDYTHQLTLNELGWGRKVFSRHELWKALDDILYHEKDHIAPPAKVELFTGFTSPVSAQVTMQTIRQWLH